MINVKKILCTIGIVFASLILLIPFWHTLILSFVDYSIMKGLFGSPFVGFENFAMFFSSAYFTKILSNTLFISILGTIIGAAYVFVASLAIGSGKNSLIKGVLAIVFAIPAIIPINVFLTILPRELLVNPSFLLKLAVSAIDGLRMAGLVVVAALFIKNNILKESLKCLLLFVAIRLIYILSADVTVITGVYNPSTYEALDVFSSYIFRTGMQNADFSLTASVHIIKVAFQFIPAVIACIILIGMSKNKPEENLSVSRSFMPAAVAAIIPVAILLAAMITGGSLLPVVFNKIVITGYINEFLIAFISALLVAIISVVLAIGARNAGVVGIIALVILCLTGNSFVGPYLITRSFGLQNTLLGVIFRNFSMISLLALILTFATRRDHGIAKDIAAFIMSFTLMFGWFWGDSFSPLMTLTDRASYPLSLILRELTMGGMGLETAGAGIPLSTVPYILIPVIIAGVGFIVSAVIKKKN